MATARFQFFTRRPATVEWRLISANNRELGRSAVPVGTLDASVGVVLDLRATIEGFTDEVLADPRGGWRWRLLRDGTPIAVSSRPFLRRVACEATLAQFRKLAAGASVLPQLRTFR
jgi:hypothetical protein